VEVGTRVGAATVAVRLELDASGDVIGASADARPRMDGQRVVPTPWAGIYGDHAVVGGVRIPTRAAVRWELPEGAFTYWRAEITALELDPGAP
jgi:hypothetical protein